MAEPDIEVSAQRAAELQAEGVTLVDVREQHEWDAGRIPGARHIPLGDLSSQAGTLDPSAPVVVLCRAGGRSLMAAQALRAAGVEAYSMAGGMLAWDAAGLPMEPDGARVAEH
ncbi:MAG: rhodanese-like domain-containing protein [Solirubrobacteraceae bacterium]|nr:rhodanese-like domain-containing protein [Solirubrobacteraceae bacterium]